MQRFEWPHASLITVFEDDDYTQFHTFIDLMNREREYMSSWWIS